MSNENNLIPNEMRTPEERRENARKAGRASGKARKKRKSMKEAACLLLDLKSTGDITDEMEQLGIKKCEQNNQMAILVSMYQETLKGNVKAATFIRDTAGELPGAPSPSSEQENDPLTKSIYEVISNELFTEANADPDIPEN